MNHHHFPNLEGELELFRGMGRYIRGWARNADQPDRPVVVDAFINHQFIGSYTATQKRKKLAQRFGDSGCYGFTIETPFSIRSDRPLEINVRFHETRQELEHSPLFLTMGPGGEVVGDPGLNFGDRLLPIASLGLLKDCPWPKVAIIILSLNGATLLSALFRSFQQYNHYPNLELILVDHGSTDDSLAVAEQWAQALPLKILARGENYSFSASNNFAAQQSDADLFLFLNNDITWHQDILGDWVRLFANETIGIAGIKLFDITDDDRPHWNPPPMQHLGVQFHYHHSNRHCFPYEIRYSPDYQGIAQACWQVPAVTGAAMMCRREDFWAIGGFHEDYFYGYEDIDLCLLMAQKLGKKIVCANHLSACHHRGFTRFNKGKDFLKRIHNNNQIIDRRFGLWLREKHRQELRGEIVPLWTGSPGYLGIICGEKKRDFWRSWGEKISNCLGWKVYLLWDHSQWHRLRFLDGVIVAHPHFPWHKVTDLKPHLWRALWLEEEADYDRQQHYWNFYDLLLTNKEKIGAFLAEKTSKPIHHICQPAQIADRLQDLFRGDRLRISIKTPVPSSKWARQWGDYHFAQGLQRALERLGHGVRVDIHPEWDRSESYGDDAVIVLRGLKTYTPQLHQVNLLWVISHPEQVTAQECAGFDQVFAATLTHDQMLANRWQCEVKSLLQCSDPDRFFYDLEETKQPPSQVLFVGNSRRVYRPIVRDAIAGGLPLTVYGQGWAQWLPDYHHLPVVIPNGKLSRYYSRCRVLLNDHWEDMKVWGFLSNRLFDAVACGTPVISDGVAGLARVFGDRIQTYETIRELRDRCYQMVRDAPPTPEQRQRDGQWIRQNHSFDQRAKELVEAIYAHRDRRLAGDRE